MKIISPSFKDGDPIPVRYTPAGKNIAPPLKFSDVPRQTMSLVIMVEDLGGQAGTWTHWLIWNIPANTEYIPSGLVPPGANQGVNSFGTIGYSGPHPISGRHAYFFRLIALNIRINLSQGASREQLEKETFGHILDEAELVAYYGQ
ncbi:MAG: YbhB/YbcL family Raf kinase inhibitor-like protein [Patescibacteria group bacterium]